MRAVRAIGSGQVRLVELADIPKLRPGEVRVATRAVGVCGSDVHVWHGTQTYPMRFPVTLGHEETGEIVELGEGVAGWSVGQRVVSETARHVCGRCQQCREGRYNLCTERVGFGALVDGSMAEMFVARQEILHAVADRVSDAVAATAEPYCVAFNAVVERARIRPGDTVGVIGPGPVGMFSAQIAGLCGASDVLVFGIPGDAQRLALARTMGASDTAVVSGSEWWRGTGGESTCDVVIDAAGVSRTLAAAIGLAKPGGQVVKVGWGPEPYNLPLDSVVAKAVDVHGSFSHTWSTWERVLRLLALGRLDPSPGLRTYHFEDWEQAFSDMSERKTLKPVLLLEPGGGA